MIAAMVGGTLRQAARLNVAGETRLGSASRIDSLQSLLKRQIEGGLPIVLPVAEGASGLIFSGTEAGAQWVVRRPSRLLPGGLYLAGLSYRAPANGRGGVLVASWQPIDPLRPFAAQSAPAESARLLENVGAFRLSYFGRKANGETGWHVDWQGERSLPALISIEAAPGAGASWRWPRLIAAPRISVSQLTAASSTARGE